MGDMRGEWGGRAAGGADQIGCGVANIIKEMISNATNSYARHTKTETEMETEWDRENIYVWHSHDAT